MIHVKWLLLALIALASAVFGIVMTIMAVQFMEWGRVLFYGFLALFSLELFIFAIVNLKKKT